MKALLAVVLMVASATNLSAAESWTAFYNKLIAYPTGAGQVYMDENGDTEEPTWADQAEMKVKQQAENVGWFYAYAKPADGWILGGFSMATLDENGQPEDFNGVFDTTKNPGYIETYSDIVSAGDYDTGTSGDSTAIAYPLDPNNVCYAVFTHVAVRYSPGQESLGTIEIDQPCNNIGDVVTITATPAANDCFFKCWTLNGETVSTDESYTLTVTGTAEYVAHFTSNRAATTDFGDGGYMWMDFSKYNVNVNIPDNVQIMYMYADSLNLNSVDGDDNTIAPFTYNGGYLLAYNIALLYGVGEATFVVDDAAVDPESVYIDEYNMLFSATKGEKISTLDNTSTSYYAFDKENEKFTLLSGDDTMSDACLLALPDTCYAALGVAPKTIYLKPAPSVTGINEVTASKKPATGIYNLQGMRQSSIRRSGIYIIDGKKVYYRK